MAMAKLGINLIFAHCPQARGRIERSFATLQDRLLKELALEGHLTISVGGRIFQLKPAEVFCKTFGAKGGSKRDFRWDP